MNDITQFNPWSEPTLIKSEEVGDTVEFTYKETYLISYAVQ